MRPTPERTLRYSAALLLLTFAIGAEAAVSSCPQLQYSNAFSPASNDQHVVILADHASGNLDNSGLSTLNGSVHVSQNGREFSTSELDYDGATQHLLVNNESLFRDPHFIIRSGTADFDLNRQSGIFTQTQFTLRQRNSRGSAARISVASSGKAELDHAEYTTCAPGDQAWVLQASSIKLSQADGLGTARNAVLRFQGVPLLYLPYFQFPIDARRTTGLLFPTIGQSGKTGFDARIPLYLNLAPNFDDTFTPRLMTRRGIQLGNNFRYLLDRNTGSFYYQYLNHDQDTGHERSFIQLQQHGLLSDRLGLDVNFAQVSDINYFDDFGGAYSDSNLADSSTPYLPRGAKLTYHGPSPYTIQLLAESYQPLSIISDPNNEPYTRLPELTFAGITSNTLHGIRAGIGSSATNFERKASIQGQRLYLDPYLRWDVDHTGWYASSRIDGTYTRYALSGPLNGLPQNPQRLLPEYSLGGGLKFERLTDHGSLQTLEPQLFYLYVPYRNQNDLPIFDSGLPDFDFPELFARNRYTGEDRIADANQLTSVLTTRLIDPVTGLVTLSASIGQIYRFVAPKVEFPGTELPSAGSSDYVGSIDYRLSRHWDTQSTVQWSSAGNRFTRGSAALRYHGEHQQRFDIAYRYRQGLFNQADVSFVAPLYDRWHVAGRLIYSIRDANSLEAFGGVEYETCCWAIRGGVRRYISSVNGNFSVGTFLQFTLKGLTSIGSGWANLLPLDDTNLSSLNRRH